MVQDVVKQVNIAAEAQKTGDIDARVQVSTATGEYETMIGGINSTLDGIIVPLLEAIDILQEYGNGNLSKEMRDLPGKQMVLTKGINNIRLNLRKVIEEGAMLTKASVEGDLEKRGDTSKFSGDYREIIAGINATLDSVTAPVKEAAAVLEKMAQGDLSHRVTSDFKGDHALIKNALNSSLDSINEVLGQVIVAIEQITTGAGEVSSASQSLSQGATEQAASLEEISASIEEVGAQTKQNAENASVANQLGEVAGKAATLGNEHMEQMLSAMTEINDSSSQVQKIIKVIDEIAFQTNLLALNAAVEAARAGVHGKGFAVVAEEVRNLAQRSAKAASETTELIEGSVAKTENGGKIADDTAKALGEISDGVTKITDIIGEIDSASREQSIAINEVSQAVTQIDQVTQTNTANAEESAAASEELSGQANQLKEMISRFKLSGSKNNGRSNGSYEEASAHVAMPLSHDNALLSEDSQSNGGELAIELPDVEDSDFGNF
ncbi:methyl-accepting chemotaxis protein I [bacterium BMS3Bbin04]|nr:methyl-accepting chemotaxis protein I [bacterium BMS3Bbin04]